MKKSKKPLSAEQIAFIVRARAKDARGGLYISLLKSIRAFKLKSKEYYVTDNDVNNVLAELIKNSTDIDNND